MFVELEQLHCAEAILEEVQCGSWIILARIHVNLVATDITVKRGTQLDIR
jgi:hypothetical protein